MTLSKPLPTTQKNYKRRSPTVESLRRFLRHRLSQVGLFILGCMVVMALFADVIAPFSYKEKVPGGKHRSAPCVHILGCPETQPQAILGIDSNGRDLFSRIIYGSRISLVVGIVTISFAIIVGGILGAVAGYAGGWIDNVIMRCMDVLMAFPGLLLAIAIVSIRGPGLNNAVFAISFVSIPIYARLLRASVLASKDLDYVHASRALGASPARLLTFHILPNTLTPLIVRGTLGIASAILETAALSFLGLGAEKPLPEWGLMLGEERGKLFTAPHLVFFPGIAIIFLVLAFNLIGDGLRDALDPRLSSVKVK